jgi:D-alanyl-D-alanine dipeptidase
MTLINYLNVPIKESGEPLVDAEKFGLLIEPVYFQQGLSLEKRIFIREGVAKKLLAIEKELKEYKFKLWDCYRPRAVQNKLFDQYYNELKADRPGWSADDLKEKTAFFVTDGRNFDKIPPHLTGGALDLTLTDLDGNDLDMGTKFDHFGPEAAALYYEENNIDDTIRSNRRILREVMIKYDFRSDHDEWWHFDFGNQLWSHDLKKPFAIYGEATLPK